jgi:hypothetical protein
MHSSSVIEVQDFEKVTLSLSYKLKRLVHEEEFTEFGSALNSLFTSTMCIGLSKVTGGKKKSEIHHFLYWSYFSGCHILQVPHFYALKLMET